MLVARKPEVCTRRGPMPPPWRSCCVESRNAPLLPPERKLLSWSLSNSLDSSFCVEALTEALHRFGTPEIFNTDQGSQFTSAAFLGVLREAGVKISMDGRGRWMDNVFIERLWRTLKHEDVYLRDYATPTELYRGLIRYMHYYNEERPHEALAYESPGEVYREDMKRNQRRGRSPAIPAVPTNSMSILTAGGTTPARGPDGPKSSENQFTLNQGVGGP